MSYHLVQLSAEFDNLDRFANSIESTLTKANRFNEEEEEYLNKFRTESAQFLQSNAHEELVVLLFEARKTLKLDSKYLNSISAITAFLVSKTQQKDKVINRFHQNIESEESINTSNKLTQFGILFNGLDSFPKIQYQLLLHLITFCKKHDRLSVLNTTLTDIDLVTKDWGLPKQQKKNLLAHIIDALERSNKHEFRCQFVLKYLQTFESTGAADDAKLESYIALLLNYGQVLAEYGSIFQTPGLKHLEKSNPTLLKLFTLFVTGDVSGLASLKATPNVLKNLGINEEEFAEKVRVQSISHFAKSGDLISYKDFAEKLNVQIDEVENWVILAISNKIIDAQIDQFNQIIYVKANYGKYLDKNEWVGMNDSLKTIIGKLTTYLQQVPAQ